MSVKVYYNFPEISVSLDGVDNPASTIIALRKVGQPIANIQLNETLYSAQSMCIYGTNDTPSHIVIKCYEDINNLLSQFVYFAIPLKVGDKSVIDDIIDKKEDVIKLSLNNHINDGGKCSVTSTKSPITIVAETTISVGSYPGNTYTSNLPDINIPSKPSMNAVLLHQELDWIMSCELLTEDEDGPKKTERVDPGTTATTISFLMMAILITAATHAVGPTVYQYSGMFQLADKTSHYAINIFWGAVLISLAVLCLGQGIVTQNLIYYFIGVSLVLSYFSGSRSILNMDDVDKNIDTDWFITKGNIPIDVFIQLGVKLFNFNIPVLIVFFFWTSSFSAILSGLPLKNDIAFSTGLGSFLLLSIGLLYTLSKSQ